MIAENFGRNLKQYLSTNKIKGRALSSKTGVTTAGISQIINGKREPNLYTVVKILNALDVTLEYVLSITPCEHEWEDNIVKRLGGVQFSSTYLYRCKVCQVCSNTKIGDEK